MAGGPPTVASAHHSTQRPPMTGAAWTSIYGATPLGGALCCDPTLVSPLSRTGLPQPCVAAHDAALQVAERRKPKAAYGGPQQLVVYIYTGADPCPSPASSASRALRRFVGMGQALVGHAGSVGAGRHGHCPRVMAWLAPPHASQQTRVGSRARSTLLTQHGRRLPLRGP